MLPSTGVNGAGVGAAVMFNVVRRVAKGAHGASVSPVGPVSPARPAVRTGPALGHRQAIAAAGQSTTSL
jgi:hypothetical protein